MKKSTSLAALSLLAASAVAPHASHAAAAPGCNGTIGHVHALSLDGNRVTTVNYTANPDNLPQSPGRFDPTPLLEGTFQVPVAAEGETPVSCVTLTFSAQALSFDNGIVFQALLDGQPLKGNAPSGPNSIANPAVFQGDPIIYDNSNNEVGRPHGQQDMLSYTFFASVRPGKHTVKVLFANCCSAFDSAPDPSDPGKPYGDIVTAATMTVLTR